MAENLQDEILAFEDYTEYNIAYPVIITRWEIKQVCGLNKQYLQVYFQKINDNVKAFQLNVACYSAFGKELEQLSNISIKEVDRKKIEFYEVMPLNSDTRRVEIAISQCLLTDGSIIEKHDRQMVVNIFKPFAEEDRAAGKRLLPNAIGYPVDNGSYWYCACGKLHAEECQECIVCKANKSAILQTITEENVQREKEQIKAEEEKNQIALAEKRKKKRKYIKIASIVGAIVVAISVLVGSLVGTLAPVPVLYKYGMTFKRNEKGYVLTDYRRNSTSVEIPSEVNGIAVVEIGFRAFQNCVEITSVTIPDSVTSIGEEAFDFCHKLVSVTIPHSVTSIGNRAFHRDRLPDEPFNLTIYCEVESKPNGWSEYWNASSVWNIAHTYSTTEYIPVVWGYKG